MDFGLFWGAQTRASLNIPHGLPVTGIFSDIDILKLERNIDEGENGSSGYFLDFTDDVY